MPTLYPSGRARLFPGELRSTRPRAPFLILNFYFLLYAAVTVDARMGQAYHEGFCRSNCNVRIHARPEFRGRRAAVR